MTCPTAVAEVILDILRQGVLACRAAGWSRDPARSAVEADHIHNLPDLLADYSLDKLQYYWAIERPSFAARCDPDNLRLWEERWDRLRPFVPNAGELISTP
jgi:hypothetical protein